MLTQNNARLNWHCVIIIQIGGISCNSNDPYLKIPLHFVYIYRLFIFNYILQCWMSHFDIAFRDLIRWEEQQWIIILC